VAKDKYYRGYEVEYKDKNDRWKTWKYGITSGAGKDRHWADLGTCKKSYSKCRAWDIKRNMKGYYRARKWEYGRIFAYKTVFGKCPPGQVYSCK
jgi:hypothetical protein